MRARERWFEVSIAILYIISDLLLCVPWCIWERLTVQTAKTGKNACSRSRTAQAHPKIEVNWRHMRARERLFEEYIAILYLISDLL